MPIQLYGKADVLFGNMEDIQRFHSSVFLRDLEECSAVPEHIGECFVERVSARRGRWDTRLVAREIAMPI